MSSFFQIVGGALASAGNSVWESLPSLTGQTPGRAKVTTETVLEVLQRSIFPHHEQHLEELTVLADQMKTLRDTIHKRNEWLYNKENPVPSKKDLQEERKKYAERLISIEPTYRKKKVFFNYMEQARNSLKELHSALVSIDSNRVLNSSECREDSIKDIKSKIDTLFEKITQLNKTISNFKNQFQKSGSFSKLRDHTFGKFHCFVSAIEEEIDPHSSWIQWCDKGGRYLLYTYKINLEQLISNTTPTDTTPTEGS